jgi:hypothetical protein
MGILINAVAILFFALWLLLTILNQFNFKWARQIKKQDVFHLLPSWTFFAPNPGTSDYHIVYRTMDDNKNISAFIEIPLQSDRQLTHACWNSSKRIKKALTDLVMSLKKLCAAEELKKEKLQVSFSYIALLNFLTHLEKSASVKFIQFAILESKGYNDPNPPQLLICSDFHHV